MDTAGKDYSTVRKDFIKGEYSNLQAKRLADPSVEIPRGLTEALINTKKPAEQILWRALEDFGVEVLELDEAGNCFFNFKIYTHARSHSGRMTEKEIMQTVKGDLPASYSKYKTKVEEIVRIIRGLKGEKKAAKLQLFCKDKKNDDQLAFNIEENGMFGSSPQSLMLFKHTVTQMFVESGYILVRWEAKPNILVKDPDGNLVYVSQKVNMGIVIQFHEWLPLAKDLLKEQYPDRAPDMTFRELEYDGKEYKLADEKKDGKGAFNGK